MRIISVDRYVCVEIRTSGKGRYASGLICAHDGLLRSTGCRTLADTRGTHIDVVVLHVVIFHTTEMFTEEDEFDSCEVEHIE